MISSENILLHRFAKGDAVAFTLLRGDYNVVDQYSGNSVCSYTGDAPGHYLAVIDSVAETFGVPCQNIVLPHQTHSSLVRWIDAPCCDADLEGVDGTATSCRGIILGINTADCVPVLLYDHVKGCVAAVHAGWRGTVAGIACNAVELMEAHGCSHHDIQAFIGASICVDCYEVGNEVADIFRRLNLGEGVVREHLSAKSRINLKEANRRLLVNAGVPAENITVSALCSKESDRLFSARRQGVASGRTLTAIMLPMKGER